MKKNLLLLITFQLILTFQVKAQIQATINNSCFHAPVAGDTATFITDLTLEGSMDTITAVGFSIMASAGMWIENAIIIDANYSAATLIIHPDTLGFIWVAGIPNFKIVDSLKPLLKITLKTTHPFADSLSWINSDFADYHGQPVSMNMVPGDFFPIPEIISDPVNMTVCSGEPAWFSIDVNSNGLALNYYWEFSSNNCITWQQVQSSPPYTGTYTDSLSIVPADSVMDGYFYHCAVDNGECSSVISGNAMLTVISNIIIQPVNQTVYENDSAIFFVLSGSSSPQYQWQVSTDGGITWNNFPPATSMFTISHTPFAWNGYLFRCIITGDCMPPDTTQPALLTVLHDFSIEAHMNVGGFSIYPNPSRGNVSLTIPDHSAFESITLTDITGQMIRNVPVLPDHRNYYFEGLQAGIYCLSMRTKDDIWSQRLVIIK